MNDRKLVFVYGTLKRGGSNHAFLAQQEFLGVAETAAGFVLFELAGFPGMVAQPITTGVSGEVWRIDADTLTRLDELEGIAEGLYRRERVPLLPPFADQNVEAYLYNRSVAGRPKIGGSWDERKRA
jgi:gamma-glutamylaminecyclotransferase